MAAPERQPRYRTDFSSLPMSAGLRVTLMPHSSMTANFSAAVPFAAGNDRARVSHALSGRRRDAGDEADHGLFHVSLTQRAQVSSSSPPISPTMMTASVSGSSLNIRMTSMCFKPLTGSPPMPTQVDWPSPSSIN